jgi:hypothetical protein
VGCIGFLLVGCSSGSKVATTVQGSSSAGPCIGEVDWRGTEYLGRSFASLPPRGHTLGTGAVPSCTDVLGGETGASRAVAIRVLAGVDPAVAVAVEGDPAHGYLAGGYFVQLPSHPLHPGARDEPNELAGCVRTGPVKLEGTVSRNAPSLVVRVSQGGVERTARVSVDARTRIERLSREGLPFVARGQRVEVEAVGCRRTGARAPKIVARRIARAP